MLARGNIRGMRTNGWSCCFFMLEGAGEVKGR
jgi:hypothetical protein